MALFKENYGPFRLKGLPARSTALNSVILDATFCKCLTYGKDSSALQCIMLICHCQMWFFCRLSAQFGHHWREFYIKKLCILAFYHAGVCDRARGTSRGSARNSSCRPMSRRMT
jgi:hypothetical protein